MRKIVRVGDHPPELHGVPQKRAIELWALRESIKLAAHIRSCATSLALIAKQLEAAHKADSFRDLRAVSAGLKGHAKTLENVNRILDSNISLAKPTETSDEQTRHDH